jgi:hypothetical protein
MIIDSKEVEWSDAELFFNGVRITKFQGFKFKMAQEKEYLYAGGNHPISIQRGNKAPGGEFRLLKGAVDLLNNAARAAGGDDLTDIVLVAVINFKPKGARTMQTVTLTGVEFTEYEYGMEQNAKSMPITLPIMYLKQEITGGN